MLETGAVLATWRLAAEPTGRAGLPISAARLGDHRRAYLDYEGPLTRDRGFVTRTDAGVFRLVEQHEDRWVIELSGGRLSGRLALVRLPDGDAWQLTLA